MKFHYVEITSQLPLLLCNLDDLHIRRLPVLPHPQLPGHPSHLLHDLLLHQIESQCDQHDAEDAVDDREGHLDYAAEALCGRVERLFGNHVAKADGGQGDEAEVQGGA